MSMKNSNDTIGNRTRDLLTCSAVLQPTAPPRSPYSWRVDLYNAKPSTSYDVSLYATLELQHRHFLVFPPYLTVLDCKLAADLVPTLHSSSFMSFPLIYFWNKAAIFGVSNPVFLFCRLSKVPATACGSWQGKFLRNLKLDLKIADCLLAVRAGWREAAVEWRCPWDVVEKVEHL